jgi:hypothetical protein
MTWLPDYWWEREPEFGCYACFDVGWMHGPNDDVIPCTECSDECTLDDIDEEREQANGAM